MAVSGEPVHPRIAALATAVPKHVIHQAEALEGARRLFAGRAREFERMAPAFANAGIETRHSSVPVEWYFEPHGWPDRTERFVETALELLEDATRRCLDEAKIGPEAVDAIVTICSTGIATPSLDAQLMERIAFRRDVMRLPVFGLGCAGGVLGLGRAAALARASPGAKVLLLVVELCGLTFRQGDLRKSNVIATALFGDGAAAALIEDGPKGAPGEIRAWGEHCWPGSLDVMGWTVEEDGLGVVFSRDIPTLVRDRMRDAADDFLTKNGLAYSDIERVVCHPGGAKVVAALEECFGLRQGALDAEREVLKRFGNMSAATVMFVLRRRLDEGMHGLSLLTSLGPGFTAAFLVAAL